MGLGNPFSPFLLLLHILYSLLNIFLRLARMTQSTRSKICEKKIKTAEIRILKILNKIHSSKLNDSYISKLSLPNKSSCSKIWKAISSYQTLGLLGFLAICGGYWTWNQLSSEKCIIELPSSAKPIFRPPIACEACASVRGVARVANVSAQEFERDYAYSMQPVIVTDGAEGWKAVSEFSFKFFKQFYSTTSLGQQTSNCFFFPYRSGFNSLQEVFSMDESRANLSGEPWYVGWSTCYAEESRLLRQYYQRPRFLPPAAESDALDWIFMGGPGQGAHMHVDSVRHTSWQAQARGKKRWQLAPPPECLYSCRWITFDVHPGEILVVDTNRWYHTTSVLPGDISITIGAEYD